MDPKKAITCEGCPKAGDTFVCSTCGMTLTCTVSCNCTDPNCLPSLTCCGKPLTKTN